MKVVLGSFVMGALLGACGLLGMIQWASAPSSAAKAVYIAATPAPGMVYVLASRQR